MLNSASIQQELELMTMLWTIFLVSVQERVSNSPSPFLVETRLAGHGHSLNPWYV